MRATRCIAERMGLPLRAPPTQDELDDLALVETEAERADILIRPDLTEMTDDGIRCIAARKDQGVYVRAGMLVTVTRDGMQRDHWIKRHPGAPVLRPVEHANMMALLDISARWVKPDKRRGSNGMTKAFPPAIVATQILARHEWPFNYLETLIEIPTIRADGSVIDTPGYDAASCILYEPEPNLGKWPGVPDKPSAENVQLAVETLKLPAQNFPFLAETDRAAYIAAVLTLIARHLIDGPCPMFPIRAPTPGTGKGLLASLIGIIGTGRDPAIMSMCDGDELRKRITALAIAGTSVALLDDVSGSLGSDVLAGALTATMWEDRLLGRTEMVRLPLRVVWLATGNNLGFQRTLGRRVVPIDLDAKLEHPEDRNEFALPDVRDFVRRNRTQLVAAALTILRGFILAGKPAHGKSKLGSFESWDDLVRSATVWTGLADPAAVNDPTLGRGRIRAQADDDIEELAALHSELFKEFAVADWTAAEVWARQERNEPLRAALDLAAAPRGDRSKPATLTSFRCLLRAVVDRPVRGLVLNRVSDPGQREQRWGLHHAP